MTKLKMIVSLLFICGTSIAQSDILITNVNVVDVRNGEILEERIVHVRNGKIHDVLSEDAPEEISGAEIIDGDNQYIVPGLAEMHAHIPSSDWRRKNAEETLFLYLSNGVTTIRGMLGHPDHLEMKQKAMNNAILSPRIFVSSPSLNGNTVPSVQEAENKVKAYKSAGYDFLKIHPGIPLAAFNQIVLTANEVDIPFAGHVPIAVGIRHALLSGYASVDHADGFLEGLVPESAGVDPSQNGFFGYNFTDVADLDKLAELVTLAKENQVWIVPTQTLFDRWFSPESGEKLGKEMEMKYMPASTLKSWIDSKNELISTDEYNVEQYEKFNAIRYRILKDLNSNGYGLLLGSDAPQVFNVPGYSIQHEMQSMATIGFTPIEILQMGTINPAAYFNMTGEFGEIIPEASADFILLEANPLLDISNMSKIKGVMVRGQWIPKAEIDSRLLKIAENAKSE